MAWRKELSIRRDTLFEILGSRHKKGMGKLRISNLHKEFFVKLNCSESE